jgi:hypothetical protein
MIALQHGALDPILIYYAQIRTRGLTSNLKGFIIAWYLLYAGSKKRKSDTCRSLK